MKSILKSIHELLNSMDKTKAKTGEKCPQGGIWHPLGKPHKKRSIGTGNVMPSTDEGDTLWTLETPSGDC